MIVLDYTLPDDFVIPQDIPQKWQRIIQAIKDCQKQGIKPTYCKIREMLGEGSFTTIRKCISYLQDKGFFKPRDRFKDIKDAIDNFTEKGVKPTYRAIAAKIRCSFNTISKFFKINPRPTQNISISIEEACQAIIDYINKFADHTYTLTRRLKRTISKCLKKHTLNEILGVLALKADNWCSNAKYRKNFNPKTLFKNFDRYYQQYEEAGCPRPKSSTKKHKEESSSDAVIDPTQSPIFRKFKEHFRLDFIPKDLATPEYERKAEYMLWVSIVKGKEIKSPIGYLKACSIEFGEHQWRGFVEQMETKHKQDAQTNQLPPKDPDKEFWDEKVKEYLDHIDDETRAELTQQAREKALRSPLFRGRQIDEKSPIFDGVVKNQIYKDVKAHLEKIGIKYTKNKEE